MWGFLVAIFSGILMSTQGVFNTQVTKQTGLWVTSAFVQFTALLVCLAAWMLNDRGDFRLLAHVRPWYLLLGGVIGAFITVTVVKATGSLGPAKAVMIIVISQIAGSYLIECLGLFGVEKQSAEWKQIFGIGISIVGVVLFSWGK